MIFNDVIKICAGASTSPVKRIYVGSTLSASFEITDSDAAEYINNVEAADSTSLGYAQGLENKVKQAINTFVAGCKTDGIWTPIQSCCILAGARTLAGALVPLKGPAPTNTNLSTYNRQLGITGTTGAYLNTNTTNFIDANVNNGHAAVYTTGTTAGGYVLGSNTSLNGSVGLRPYNTVSSVFRMHSGGGTVDTSGAVAGFAGVSRNTSTAANIFYATASGPTSTTSIQSSTFLNQGTAPIYVFDRSGPSALNYNQKISFYSIGTFMDLTLLNTRVTTLMNSLALI